MLWDRCLSVCLSVCDVGALCQTVGRMKMKLGTEVSLGPGDIVLDGDPTPLPQKWGAQCTAPPIWPMSIVAKRLNGSR